MAVVVGGQRQFEELGARLLAEGAGKLRLEFLAELRKEVKPLLAATRQAAAEQLPKSGGLAARVAKSPMFGRNRLTGRAAGVRLFTSEHDTMGTDRGTVRHPVFGHDPWVVQPLAKSGWWSETLARKSSEVTPHLIALMERIGREVQGL